MRLCSVCALIALLCTAAQANDHQAQFLQLFDWSEEAHGSGGFSGLEVFADGSSFVTIDDRALMLYVGIERQAGKIAKLKITRRRWLVQGARDDLERDSEGLALMPDGSLMVSYEAIHRIEQFGPKGRGTRLSGDALFANLPLNGGLEALAVDARGRLVAMPERSGRLNRDFPVWRFDGAWRQVGTLPRSAPFLPVGADFGPDGRLYVLERGFSGFGFRSRLRSFVLRDGLQDERTHLETRLGQFSNLEGLSVWRDTEARLRVTMISDDNFKSFMPTQIVEYVLSEGLATPAASR